MLCPKETDDNKELFLEATFASKSSHVTGIKCSLGHPGVAATGVEEAVCCGSVGEGVAQDSSVTVSSRGMEHGSMPKSLDVKAQQPLSIHA